MSAKNYFDLYDTYLEIDSSRDQALHDSLLEETAARISGSLAHILQTFHGEVLEFEALTRPLAYLAIYQIAPGRHQQPGTESGLESFASYKSLAAVKPGDRTHALLVTLLNSQSPLEYASSMLPGSGKENRGSMSSEAGAVSGKRIGVTFGTSFLDRALLNLFSPGILRFVRGRDLTAVSLDTGMRQRLLDLVQSAGEQDNESLAVLAYLVLVMPTFMVEGFAHHLEAARKLSAGLRGLVIGTEFQRKPVVAVLIALAKTRGWPIVAVQHGGGYGQTDPNWWERAERYLSDTYRTWGYVQHAEDKPLPSIKLSRQAKKARGRGGQGGASARRILLAIPYISEEMECSLFSPPYARQLEAVEHSLSLVQPLLQNGYELSLRVHPKNAGAAFFEKLSIRGLPGVEISAGQRGSIVEDARRYQALLFSSPQATGLAECLAGGCDFYVAARPEDFWIRDQARDIYQEMVECGIWLDSQDKVAGLLQDGFATSRPEQRAFRERFAARFALSSNNYLSQWTRMLRDV